MDIVKVGQKHRAADTSGWREPNFTATNISDLRTRWPLTNQEEFIYCRKTIEGEDPAEHEERENCQLHQGFKEVIMYGFRYCYVS